MKLNIILILLIFPFKIFCQDISNKSIVGVWEVIDAEIDSKIFNNFDSEKINNAKSFFQTVNFTFGKNGLVEIQTKQEAPTPFNNDLFNYVFYFNIEHNVLNIGSRKKSSNILYIQVKEENGFLYFNLIGALLKLKKTENTIKLIMNNNIKSPNSLIENKPFLQEKINDDELITDNIDQSISTFNCYYIIDKDLMKKCVSDTVMDFFMRKFNTDIAADLALTGLIKNKIDFIVNKEGNIINIELTTVNPELSNEIKRTLNQLPKFIPARHNGKNVHSKYSFPFIFRIQD